MSVQKIHSTATPTFSGQQLVQQQERPQGLNSWFNPKPSIDLSQLKQLNIATYYALPLAIEQQAMQLQHCLALNNVQAIIILAFGSGNLSQHPLIEQALQQAAKQQVLVVLASQVPFGGVNSRYAAGDWLNQFGVLSAAYLPLPAVYARLAYLLCQNLSFAERKQYWQLGLTN